MDQPQTPIPTIPGTPFAGGFYVGRINIAGAVHALIVAPRAEGEFVDVAWHEKSPDVPSAASFFDGRGNTIAMAEAGSELAKRALNLRIADHDDWYLPSRDELELCYRHLKPTAADNWCYRGDNPSSVPAGYPYSPAVPWQTDVTAFREGAPEAFTDEWYWSSTQYAGSSLYAWGQNFSSGNSLILTKGYVGRARAVRRFLII